MKRSEYLKIATEPFTVRTHEFIADRLVAEGVLEADKQKRLDWEGEEIGVETTHHVTLGVGADGNNGIIATDARYEGVASYPNYEGNLRALARRSNLLLELEQWADGLSFYGDELSQEDGARVLIPAALIRKLWGEA